MVDHDALQDQKEDKGDEDDEDDGNEQDEDKEATENGSPQCKDGFPQVRGKVRR